MHQIGIIRGFGEGYEAGTAVIKLIKALNRRFRSKINFTEIPLGNYKEHGSIITVDALDKIKECDVLYICDMISLSNPIEYDHKSIAHATDNNVQYLCVSGFGNHSGVDIQIASYFDGGSSMRDVVETEDGCMETKICSSYSIKNIVKTVGRSCENRRRRLAFVFDDDNEYCAKAFYSSFSKFLFPLSNFHLLRFSQRDICREILFDMKRFDTIFASSSFAEAVLGMFEYKMQNGFAFYYKFENTKPVYAMKSHTVNSGSGDYVPSMCSYIVALCDLIRNEFDMKKEAAHLRLALDEAINNSLSPEENDAFISFIVKALDKPVLTKYPKSSTKKKYIR